MGKSVVTLPPLRSACTAEQWRSAPPSIRRARSSSSHSFSFARVRSGICAAQSLSRSPTGGFLEAELLDRDLSHLEFLDLARDRHRKRVDELPVPGDLVGGDLALAPRGELLARLCRPLAQLAPGHYLFAVLLGPAPDALHVHDVRVRVEELFDLAGVDVLPAPDDHVLDPADDIHVTVGIHPRLLAALPPPRPAHAHPLPPLALPS